MEMKKQSTEINSRGQCPLLTGGFLGITRVSLGITRGFLGITRISLGITRVYLGIMKISLGIMRISLENTRWELSDQFLALAAPVSRVLGL